MMLAQDARDGGGEARAGDRLGGDAEPRPAGTDGVAGGSGLMFDRGINNE
jgi:hypothetical protein